MFKCNLKNDQISRYSRQLILPQFGVKSQIHLHESNVLVIGCGGLGCPATVYLAAAGVGNIGLVDDDVVEINNLHRQVMHSETTVGVNKAESLKQRCQMLNSNLQITTYPYRLTSSNVIKTIKNYDVVLDCTDNAPTRYLINDACAALGRIPLVSGSALRFEGHLTVYLSDVPIKLRGDQSESNDTPCYRCLYPIPPPVEAVGSCSQSGVMGVVPGIIGTMQAAEAIKILSNIGDSMCGKLFMYDCEHASTRIAKLGKRKPNCKACGSEVNDATLQQFVENSDYAVLCGMPAHDKDPEVNNTLDSTRMMVAELSRYRSKGMPYILIDIRPTVETEIAHLKPCVFLPQWKSKLTSIEKVYDVIVKNIKEGLFTKDVEVKICFLCHRGNDSVLARNKFAPTFESDVREYVVSLQDGAVWLDKLPSFTCVDIVGGLAMWSKKIDEEFPVY